MLEGLSLSLERGEIGCVVGSSGCGKTTLLRAIAGFLPVATGTIEIDGLVVSGPHFTAPPERRSVGLVFQDYALFPHLTVEGNVRSGCVRLPRQTAPAACRKCWTWSASHHGAPLPA